VAYLFYGFLKDAGTTNIMLRIIRVNRALASFFLTTVFITCLQCKSPAQANMPINCFTRVMYPVQLLDFIEQIDYWLVGDDWHYMDYRVLASDTLAMRFRKDESEVNIYVNNRVLPDATKYHTGSFQLRSEIIQGRPLDTDILLLNLIFELSINDNGNMKLDFADERIERHVEFKKPASKWPSARRIRFLKLILIVASSIISILIFLSAPLPIKNTRHFIIFLFLSIIVGFFVVPDLLIDYSSGDYHIYTDSLKFLLNRTDMPINDKPIFIFKAFLDIFGYSLDNLFLFSRFMSVLLMVSVYLFCLCVTRNTRISAIAGVLILSCPGMLMATGAITRHLHAATFIFVSLIFMISSARSKVAVSKIVYGIISIFLLVLGILQKGDFFYFSFIYFLVFFTLDRKQNDFSIWMVIAKSAVCGAVIICVVLAADKYFNLMWLEILDKKAGSNANIFLSPRYLFNEQLHFLVASYILIIPPVFPLKAICLAGWKKIWKYPSLCLPLLVCVLVFILEYLMTLPWLPNVLTMRTIVISPFIIIGSAVVLENLLFRSRVKMFYALIFLSLAANAVYYPYLNHIHRNAPKALEYRMLKKVAEEHKGCVVFTSPLHNDETSLPQLWALNPAAEFEIYDISDFIRPGSDCHLQYDTLDYCLHGRYYDVISNKHIFAKRANYQQVWDIFLSHLYYSQNKFKVPIKSCISDLGNQYCRDRGKIERSPAPDCCFSNVFHEYIRSGKCALFFQSSYRLFNQTMFTSEEKDDYILSILETQKLYEAGFSAIYRITGINSTNPHNLAFECPKNGELH